MVRDRKIDLVLEWESKLTLFQYVVEINLVSSAESKLTSFYRRDRTSLFFCAGGKIIFDFVCGPKIARF